MSTLNPFVIIGSLMQTLLPAPVVTWLQGLVEGANRLLQGSPARAIGYGAAIVIYGVALIFDRIPDMTLEQALTTAVTAVTLLVGIVEAIRKYVFSPASVADLTGADVAKKVEVKAGTTTAIVVEPKGDA